MRLKHRAPVVHIQVIDQKSRPIPDAQIFEQQQANESPTTTHDQQQHDQSMMTHKVIICSEEQFKVFQLPTLKPYCKFKLTAVEGARVRRIGYNKFISKNDPNYSEYCLSCLSNLGDLSVYNLPNLKRQMQTQCMKQQDINAITSFVFSKLGQAFYLQSPSELLHISMSACDNIHNAHLANLLRQQAQAEKEARLNKKNKVTIQQTPQSTTNKTLNQNLNQITSPSSPPPPIPAPRSTSVTNKESPK
jgi:lethal(2) giant larvae protein